LQKSSNKIKLEDVSFVRGSSSKRELKGAEEASNGTPSIAIRKLFKNVTVVAYGTL
jgi:hypothetical protein